MAKVFYILMVFMSGFLANANISKLVETNPNYHASWEKFFGFVALSIIFGAFASKERN